jgi:hypothetical protein
VTPAIRLKRTGRFRWSSTAASSFPREGTGATITAQAGRRVTGGWPGCHRGVFRRLRIHPEDWELSHPGAARAGLLDCDECHRSQSKCLSCHRLARVAESSPHLSKNLRMHPDGYKAGGHSADARRNLRACTACHAEGDCIRCHGAAEIGLGLSPHPSGFSKRCGLLKSRNSRPCLKCHLPSDLESKCP